MTLFEPSIARYIKVDTKNSNIGEMQCELGKKCNDIIKK